MRGSGAYQVKLEAKGLPREMIQAPHPKLEEFPGVRKLDLCDELPGKKKRVGGGLK